MISPPPSSGKLILIDFFLRIVVLLRGLDVRRRVWTVRRRGLGEALRRPRLAALKARQPFLNPILAYFLGSPGLGTWKPSKEPLLSYACTHWAEALMLAANFAD